MDLKLLAWGLRHRRQALPRLWLFTDAQLLGDPRVSAAHLPIGRAGVVLRHDQDPDRAALGRDLARICRVRRLALVVAGDVRLAAALGVGVHLRGGRWPGPLRRRGMVTSSAHSVAELRRAGANGACLGFLSPAFPTASHAGAPGLGPLRWAAMARTARAAIPHAAAAKAGSAKPAVIAAGTPGRGRSPIAVAALGGVTGRTVKRLPAPLVEAVGAIGALRSG